MPSVATNECMNNRQHSSICVLDGSADFSGARRDYDVVENELKLLYKIFFFFFKKKIITITTTTQQYQNQTSYSEHRSDVIISIVTE